MIVQARIIDANITSLAAARQWVLDNRREGAVCPCCDQLAKVYKRKLNQCMVYALLLIYRAQQRNADWIHAPSYLHKNAKRGPTVRGGDFAKLVHWGLIETKPESDRGDGSKRAGYYKITSKGRDFVDGKIRLPKHVFLYASAFLGFSDESTSFRDAFGEKFNYDELMAS